MGSLTQILLIASIIAVFFVCIVDYHIHQCEGKECEKETARFHEGINLLAGFREKGWPMCSSSFFFALRKNYF